jgi:predicted naringenin-chalcone synthase
VPEQIEQHFEDVLVPFVERSGIGIEDVDHFLFHPGGRKILRTADEWLGRLGKNIAASHEVMRDYGNMSSATVLYVLEKSLAQSHQPGEHGLVLSFGPGFTAQRVLLRWSSP